MIDDNGNACIADIGLNIGLIKSVHSTHTLAPSGWMYKAPEEISPSVDLSAFTHTKAMDVYAFATTTYSVRKNCRRFGERLKCFYIDFLFRATILVHADGKGYHGDFGLGS